MNEFMKMILSLSVSGTLLFLLIFGLKPLYKNVCSRRWQYFIWIIVALRFLLPIAPGATIVGSMFERFDQAVITNEIYSDTNNPPVFPNVEDGETEPTQPDGEGTVAALQKPSHGSAWLFLVWCTVALALFIRKLTIYQSFLQSVRAGNREISDVRILNLLSDCRQKENIRTRVELSRNSRIASPIMTGFFCPRILLPVGELEDSELSYIFLHELTHYRQKDMFYKWLIQIVVCVHWFNPFVYLLEKEVNRSCELSCDEKVLSMLDDRARREYGDMLLSFLKANDSRRNSLASVTLTEGAKQLKERLGAIMKYRKKTKSMVLVTVILSVVFGFCFLATGAYAAPSADRSGAMIWKDSEIRNEVLTEDGVYYILCEGAGEEDKPQATVSVGSIQFVLVRKDSWTSIGPFDNKESLVREVTEQCKYMKNLTEKEKELVLEAAIAICSDSEDSTDKANSSDSKAKENSMTIVHERADILCYEDGAPYVHDVLTNNTDKNIVETQYCMLAYSEKGSPLKLYWYFIDSSVESSYENIVRTKANILPGQTEKYRGGWSLYDGERVELLPKDGNGEVSQVAYILLCLKQVTFEDGIVRTVWDNPDYEEWFETYAGKEIDLYELQNYYPREYKIELD